MPRSIRTAFHALPASLLVLGALSLAGCGAASSSATATTAGPTATTLTAASPTATAAPASPTVDPASVPLGQTSVRIYYGEAAQFEIVTPSGPVVFIDIWDPSKLVNKPTTKDVLLTTHSHPDHLVPDFEGSFPGKKITMEATTLKAGDISIEGIAARHDEGQELAQKDGSDYIFVIDVAGMRLAHFGDFGQEQITSEQLAKLGKVDVAFSQLANSYSSMDENNKKGFNEMNQLAPRLLIATHLNEAVVKMAPTIWQTAWATGPVVVSKDKLPAKLTCLFMGGAASGYGKLFGIPPFQG